MHFNPTAKYEPWKQLVLENTLSKHSQAAVTREITELTNETKAHEDAVHQPSLMSSRSRHNSMQSCRW
jgi:hypothetical protein